MQAIRYYLQLSRDSSPQRRLLGYAPTPLSIPGRGDIQPESDDPHQLFHENRLGMWFVSSLFVFHEGETQVMSVAPPPLGRSDITSNDFSSTGLYISAKSQHPEACWSWLKYLTSEVSGLQGGFPARISLANSDAFVSQAPRGATEVYQAYLQAFNRPSKVNDTSVSFYQSPIDYYWFFQAIDRAMQGRDLEKSLADAQKLTTQFLTCIRDGTPGSTCAMQVDPEYQGWKNFTSATR